MNEKDYADIEHKIDEGLALAEQRMLREKALHDDNIVVYDPATDSIVSIAAKEVLAARRS